MIGMSPDVVIVKSREPEVCYSAEAAAGKIINSMLDYSEGYLTVAPKVVRYTTGDLQGGDLSEQALDVFAKLPARPKNPYPGGPPAVEGERESMFSRPTREQQDRMNAYDEQAKAWRADAMLMVIAGLGLR